MGFYIDGGKFYPERKIPIWYNSDEKFLTEMISNDRYRIILVENGTGILNINGQRIAFISPVLFCINEEDFIELEKGVNIVSKSFYIHPQFINDALTFENIRGMTDELTLTDRQDRCLFKPFIERNSDYVGQLNIEPAAAQRISRLLDSINQEINSQIDWYWPCRARSYFLELLLILERIYITPKSKEKISLSDSLDTIDEIILYLHTHYEHKITISKLCKLFNINRTTLQEEFQSVTGLPVITYLIKLRIKLSLLMLKDTEITIAEIIERTGFSDGAHFNKMFRKYTGYSPTEYRQQFTWL